MNHHQTVASIGRIVRDVLHFRKISSHWVPRLLTEEHKNKCSGAALEFLTLYHKEGDDLIKRVEGSKSQK